VAAAFEGIVIGVPGIAVSLAIERPWHHHDEPEIHFDPVADFAARLAKVTVKHLPPGRILTVNAPNLPESELKGARVTKLGRRFYTDELIAVEDESGRVGYDIYNNPPGRHEEEGTDFAAVEAGEISVTPVHLKLTDEPGLEELESWDIKSLLWKDGYS
jgi:5'-nucleotidase